VVAPSAYSPSNHSRHSRLTSLMVQTPPKHPGSSALLVMHRSLVYRGNVLG
jgi:hypothetical protein